MPNTALQIETTDSSDATAFTADTLGTFTRDMATADLVGLTSRPLRCSIAVVDTTPPVLDIPAWGSSVSGTVAAGGAVANVERSSGAAAVTAAPVTARDALQGEWDVAADVDSVSLASTGTHLLRYTTADSSSNAAGTTEHTLRLVVREEDAAVAARRRPPVASDTGAADVQTLEESIAAAAAAAGGGGGGGGSASKEQGQKQRGRRADGAVSWTVSPGDALSPSLAALGSAFGSHVTVVVQENGDIEQTARRVVLPSQAETSVIVYDVSIGATQADRRAALLAAFDGVDSACGTLHVVGIDDSKKEVEVVCVSEEQGLVGMTVADLPPTPNGGRQPYSISRSPAQDTGNTGAGAGGLQNVLIGVFAGVICLLVVVIAVLQRRAKRAGSRVKGQRSAGDRNTLSDDATAAVSGSTSIGGRGVATHSVNPVFSDPRLELHTAPHYEQISDDLPTASTRHYEQPVAQYEEVEPAYSTVEKVIPSVGSALHDIDRGNGTGEQGVRRGSRVKVLQGSAGSGAKTPPKGISTRLSLHVWDESEYDIGRPRDSEG